MSRVYLSVHRSNGVSLVTEGDEWIYSSGSAGRGKAGGEADRYDHGDDGGKCPWIGDGDNGDLAGEEAGERKAGEKANEDACRHQAETVEEDKAQNTSLLRAESHADANLARLE